MNATIASTLRPRPLSHLEAVMAHRQWLEDTKWLRERAAHLVATYQTVACWMVHSDGTHTVIRNEMPPVVLEVYAMLQEEIAAHARRLGLTT